MTAEEIIKVLTENYSYESICDGNWKGIENSSEIYKEVQREYDRLIENYNKDKSNPNPWSETAKYTLNKLGLGEVEKVDSYGGEGQGESYWAVHYFKDHDVYIRIDGWYQSYNGAEFYDPPYEVKPKQKTITVYN